MSGANWDPVRSKVSGFLLILAILWFPFITIPAAFVAFHYGQHVLGLIFALGAFESVLIYTLSQAINPREPLGF